jgi:hypothetical protein
VTNQLLGEAALADPRLADQHAQAPVAGVGIAKACEAAASRLLVGESGTVIRRATRMRSWCGGTRPRLSLNRLGSVVRLGSEDRGVSFGFEDTAQSMLWPETPIAD